MTNKEILKKQIIYRSMHRGTKEMDILLGNFVKTYINEFNDNELKDSNGNLQDSFGINFLVETTNHENWVRTYKQGVQRKNYATIGGTYDSSRDAFIPIQPYNSWVLDESTCQWIPPVTYPDDDKFYIWNEESTSWVETDPPPEWNR